MIQGFAFTAQGPGHSTNQDDYRIVDDLGLYVVSDGMGGHSAGHIASAFTVDILTRFIRRSHQGSEITWPFGIETGLSPDENRLRTAALIANRRVWREADMNEERIGMGATLVAMLATEATATLCWVGDSRVYLLRDGELEQLTRDDSFAAEALDQGMMSADRIAQHPMRNMVTRAIGTREQLDPHLKTVPTKPGDLYLLCSDGVYKSLDSDMLRDTLLSLDCSSEDAAEKLVAAAVDAGSDDDVTAMLVAYG